MVPACGRRGRAMHQTMPKASVVAEIAHPMVPGAPNLPCPGAQALACPHTGGACPALAAVFGPLGPHDDGARAWLLGLAPCAQCRISFAAGRANLRHLRLGQREREILLAAAAGGPLTVTEPGMSRSVSAARRRAALSLGKAGLVTACDGGSAKALGPQRATVQLTDLGRFVLAAYGRFLKGGKPVRWTRPARDAMLPGREPSELVGDVLARTQGALRETLTELKGVLVAAIGGRLKDPSQLDVVTRHLERKATLLKAVLESAQPSRS